MAIQVTIKRPRRHVDTIDYTEEGLVGLKDRLATDGFSFNDHPQDDGSVRMVAFKLGHPAEYYWTERAVELTEESAADPEAMAEHAALEAELTDEEWEALEKAEAEKVERWRAAGSPMDVCIDDSSPARAVFEPTLANLAREYGRSLAWCKFQMRSTGSPRKDDYKTAKAEAWNLEHVVMPRIGGHKHLPAGNEYWPAYDEALWSVFREGEREETGRREMKRLEGK